MRWGSVTLRLGDALRQELPLLGHIWPMLGKCHRLVVLQIETRV